MRNLDPLTRWTNAELPFGFGISIGEIMNSFNISDNGTAVAGLSTVSIQKNTRPSQTN